MQNLVLTYILTVSGLSVIHGEFSFGQALFTHVGEIRVTRKCKLQRQEDYDIIDILYNVQTHVTVGPTMQYGVRRLPPRPSR